MLKDNAVRLGIASLAAFVALIGSSFITVHFTSDIGKHWHSLIVNLAFTLLAIAGTVLVVDRLNGARDAREERRRLLRDMSAIDNPIALRGACELKELGAFETGFFDRADLSGANLSKARLQNLKAAQLKLIGATLGEADLSRACLPGVLANFARFDSANLEDASMRGGTAVGASFSRADLSRADLSECLLKSADFRHADLCNANLSGANLVGADLSGAKLDGCRLEGATVGTELVDLFPNWKVKSAGQDEYIILEVNHTAC